MVYKRDFKPTNHYAIENIVPAHKLIILALNLAVAAVIVAALLHVTPV